MPGDPVCLYDAPTLAARVGEMGAEIRRRFPGEPLVLLGILNGAIFFAADLARVVGVPLALSFVRAASYGAGHESSGRVTLDGLDEAAIRGRKILICDTILDTGNTLQEVSRRIRAAGAEEVFRCVLLDKPSRREVDIDADLVGFTIPDRFVVGYGLDDAGRYRALDYVGEVVHG